MSKSGDQMLERVRLYGSRTRRMVLGGGLAHPCLFLHLPKCGGTSLSAALYASVPMQRRIAVLDALSTRRAAAILAFGQDDPDLCHDDHANGALTFDLRERILLTHRCWDTHLVHGHFLLTDRVERFALPHYKIVTMMREPAARAVSNLRQAIDTGTATPDVEGWLAGPVGRQHATVALRYLSGRQAVAPEDEADALAVALRRLERIALVGFIEDTPAFLVRFEAMFGVRLRLGRANADRGPKVTLSAPQAARLETLCAADRTIYARAREMFG